MSSYRNIFDLFSYSLERKSELNLILQYERDLNKLLPLYKVSNHELIKELALLPMEIKGFGHVKLSAIAEVAKKRDEIIAQLGYGSMPQLHAAE